MCQWKNAVSEFHGPFDELINPLQFRGQQPRDQNFELVVCRAVFGGARSFYLLVLQAAYAEWLGV